MKRFIFVSLLLATPALAQQPPSPGQQVAALTKQVSDLTKERDDLKAAKPAGPAPAADPAKQRR
jgi:hypothetical protein